MDYKEFEKKYCSSCGSIQCAGILDKEFREGCPYYKAYKHSIDRTVAPVSYLCPRCNHLAYYDSYFGRLMCTNQKCNYESESLRWADFSFMSELDKNSSNPLKETIGQSLNIGDKVRMNIPCFEDSDRDGVEFTISDKNYWRYMNQHPNEIYTVTGFDYTTDDDQTTYLLSGYMEGTNWYSDELILIPEPQSNFELIKNMSIDDMARLFSNKTKLTQAKILKWLNEKPTEKERVD